MDQLVRTLFLLSLVPAHPRHVTTLELRARLEQAGHRTSLRSIQRTLVRLAAHLPLERVATAKPHGWRWMAEVTPPLPPMRSHVPTPPGDTATAPPGPAGRAGEPR